MWSDVSYDISYIDLPWISQGLNRIVSARKVWDEQIFSPSTSFPPSCSIRPSLPLRAFCLILIHMSPLTPSTNTHFSRSSNKPNDEGKLFPRASAPMMARTAAKRDKESRRRDTERERERDTE